MGSKKRLKISKQKLKYFYFYDISYVMLSRFIVEKVINIGRKKVFSVCYASVTKISNSNFWRFALVYISADSGVKNVKYLSLISTIIVQLNNFFSQFVQSSKPL